MQGDLDSVWPAVDSYMGICQAHGTNANLSNVKAQDWQPPPKKFKNK